MAYIKNVSIDINHVKFLEACSLQELVSIKESIDNMIKEKHIKDRNIAQIYLKELKNEK